MDSSTFQAQPIESWIKAILRPYNQLAIPKRDSHVFQILVAVTLDQLWLARFLAIHKAGTPDISSTLKQINFTSKAHFLAWQNLAQGSDCWQPPPSGHLKVNFDIAIRPSLAVVVAVLSDSEGSMM